MDLRMWIILAVGIFSFCGGFFDWNFFMTSRRARFFVGIMGRNGARIFYMILGLLFGVAGILMGTGVIPMQS